MKKLISLLLALIAVIFTAVPSYAAKSVKFTASDCEVFTGDEFTVDIFISDYSLLKSATLLVEYDKKAMQFLNLNIGAIVTAGSNAVSYKDVNNANKSYVQIDYKDSSASLSTAGKFLSLTFVANDTAAGGTTVKLSVRGNKITVSSGSVTPEFKNGKINIINNNPVTELKPEPSSEDVSSAPVSSENAENPQNTAPKPSESKPQNTNNSDIKPDKDKAESKKATHIAVLAVIITVIVICVLLFGSNSKSNTKSKKKKKRKKRKSRRR